MQTFQPRAYKVLPDVIKNLLIINGIFFLATWTMRNTMGFDLSGTLGLYQPGSAHFRPWQLLTSVFMHGSFEHLFFNMFALWMFGSAIENVWGAKRFLVYYLATAVGASLFWAGVNYLEILSLKNELISSGVSPDLLRALAKAPDLSVANDLLADLRVPATDALSKFYWIYNVPVVGASGAVFGILLAFGMMFPNAMIYLYFAIPIKAKWFVIGYGVLELVSGMIGSSNIAHFAHLGGMVFGYFLIRYWQRHPNRFSRWM